jgi:hypothetical protein
MTDTAIVLIAGIFAVTTLTVFGIWVAQRSSD